MHHGFFFKLNVGFGECTENKPGFCPLPDERMRTVCENICYSDANCPDERKCCWTGCGSICMSPSHTSQRNDERPWITTSPETLVDPTTWAVHTREWQPPTPYYPDPYSEEHDRYEEDRNRDRFDTTEAPITRDWRPPTPYYPDYHGETRHEEDRDRHHHEEDSHNTEDTNTPFEPGTLQ